MNHLICLNTNSFPAESSEDAYSFFNDALQGMLRLGGDNDRFTMYLDAETSLNEFFLAENYSYSDFSDQLKLENEHDLALFLLELDDKSPAFDYIDDDDLEDMAKYSFYMPNCQLPENGEVFNLAYFLSATLLSINTSEKWNSLRLDIARIDESGRYIDETLTLNNIACIEHGNTLFDEFNNVDIDSICDSCVVTELFIAWYRNLTFENQYKVINKYTLAIQRQFEGGEPLFKTLDNGMREIRFSAYSGGAIRILFKAFSVGGRRKQAILLGFIKKNNNEGYARNIPKAHDLFNEITN